MYNVLVLDILYCTLLHCTIKIVVRSIASVGFGDTPQYVVLVANPNGLDRGGASLGLGGLSPPNKIEFSKK